MNFLLNISMRIGIVGAGPAGASLAEKAARQGHEVWLFDHRAPWEKPCGGGLTPRVAAEFPECQFLPLSRQEVAQVILIGPTGRETALAMSKAWHTVSRKELAQALLKRAQAAGVKFFPARVLGMKQGRGFEIETRTEKFAVDFLVGADGATGLTRRALAGKWQPQDLCRCYGFLLPCPGPVPLVIRFYPDMLGYAWVFPRPGNLFSAGIAASGSALGRDALVDRLQRLVIAALARSGLPAPNFPKPYAALLPSLSAKSFAAAKVGGKSWALVGDASGAVDPITGEGIAYAFQTSRLLAEALAEDQGRSYPARWQEAVRLGIGRAASMRDRFYRPRNLRLYSLLLAGSPTVRQITRDLIFGSQNYAELKPRVLESAPRILRETACSWMARPFR